MTLRFEKSICRERNIKKSNKLLYNQHQHAGLSEIPEKQSLKYGAVPLGKEPRSSKTSTIRTPKPENS